MIEVGRLCVKLAGRDSRSKCVILDIIDNNYVLIDGQTRRKKCNIKHLEPLDKVIKIKKKAPHANVVKEFKKLKIEVKEKTSKKQNEKPKKVRKSKTPKHVKKVEEKKETKKETEEKTEKKEEKPKEVKKASKKPVKKK
ncbi:50S ribosomal protein L14e [Candidatus Woesearchaeota archaeon]|nr:50S ribosomal protein L14e [Candidatus Woesearchaeota archaeon]